MVEKARETSTKVIEGDFDPKDSPFHFPGKLVVKGDVPDKVEIQTNDGVEIDGIVGAAVIRTNGDIIIKGGASGPGYLHAGRDIRLGFVANATLVCARDMIIGVSAMHSHLSAGHRIIISGGKGVLVGGIARAGMTISSAKIGSRMYTPTELEAGIHPLLRSEYTRLTGRISQTQQTLDTIQKNIEYLEGLTPENITERMAKRIEKLPLMHLRVKHLSGELKKYISRRETLVQTIDRQNRDGRIDVTKEIFPRVIITVDWTTRELEEHLRNVTFFEQGGEIKWESLQLERAKTESSEIEDL